MAQKLNELIYIRSHSTSPISVYKCKVLKKIYENAKVNSLGFSRSTIVTSGGSYLIKIFQRRINLTNALYQRNKNDLFLIKLQILHKPLLNQYSHEKQLKFAKWISKLIKLDYQRSTKSFYPEFNGKNHN